VLHHLNGHHEREPPPRRERRQVPGYQPVPPAGQPVGELADRGGRDVQADQVETSFRQRDVVPPVPAADVQATAQYKATRRAVIAVLSADDGEPAASRLAQIGREYAEAFNKLDDRTPFIETEEREELFAALDLIIADAQATTRKDLTAARQSLTDGAEAARNW
jgi:hypothetical protein